MKKWIFTFIKLLNRLCIGVTGGSNITREDFCQGPAEEDKLLLLLVFNGVKTHFILSQFSLYIHCLKTSLCMEISS